ncbi:unnamed protein product [Thelazia callipaeda]|uniref:D-lactate dehydratase n=1 Tax=Thelazia callipaeda TaxID=103827 RepID=A0A0N5CNU9_THECL|nr:unnamed protein product [Thelazia callipaeda]
MALKRAMLILTEGAEEMETVIAVDVLRRAGIQVVIAGLWNNDSVKCSRQVIITPDTALSELREEKFDVIILPGGLHGANTLSSSHEVGDVLRAQINSGRLIAAICAAPIALKSHGIAVGSLVTSHPSVKQALIEGGYKYSEDRVVVTDRIITSRGPGTALDFAIKLTEILVGKEKVKEIAASMLVDDHLVK